MIKQFCVQVTLDELNFDLNILFFIKIMYYSQCQEDIFLNENIFKNKKNGVYIELGALDGVLYSNTKFYEDSINWKGILIEPHPEKFKLLQNVKLKNNLIYKLNYISGLIICKYSSNTQSTIIKHI